MVIFEKQNYKVTREIIANMFRNRMQEYYQKEDNKNLHALYHFMIDDFTYCYIQ